MDWQLPNDFDPDDQCSNCSSLEVEDNIDYCDVSNPQDNYQPPLSLEDHHSQKPIGFDSSSYEDKLKDASKALSNAFHDAQKVSYDFPSKHNDSDTQSYLPPSVLKPDYSQTWNLSHSFHPTRSSIYEPVSNPLIKFEDSVPVPFHDNHDRANLSNHAFDQTSNLLNSHSSAIAYNDRRCGELNDDCGMKPKIQHSLKSDNLNRNLAVGDSAGNFKLPTKVVGRGQNANMIRVESSVTDGSRTSSVDASRSGSSSHPSNSDIYHSSSSNRAQPFRSSDAPCELRANFLQAQRHTSHPVMSMVNQEEMKDVFDYAMAVPKYNPSTKEYNGSNDYLKDSRHQLRNEREQQRAAKISEIIDQLRSTMVQGGWKVEMKSKYQVLSTSAEYLRHLIELTKTKETELQKAKEDFAIRNQKLDEDRVLQDGSTDDSFTSSLTASFTGTRSSDEKWKGSSGTGDSSTNVTVASVSLGRESSKRKIHNESSEEGGEHQRTNYCNGEKRGDDDSNHDSNNSGNLESNNLISLRKKSSGTSDVIDSNHCSSDGQGNNGSSKGLRPAFKAIKPSFNLSELADAGNDTSKSGNSVSTTEAVVSGEDDFIGEHKHSSIIFTKDRKRKMSEKTSLDEDFQLSYQEVFISSNVPQLIATPSGRIVACNDFFFRMTGLTEKDIKKITIFSMVQVDHLSILFELVADALRRSNTFDVSNTTSTVISSKPSSMKSSEMEGYGETSSSNSDGHNSISNSRYEENEPSGPPLQFETVVLPCVSFPNVLKNSNNGQEKNLYMNVTFIYDGNPSKRCIHLAFTDTQASGGKIGSVTPELLALVFPTS